MSPRKFRRSTRAQDAPVERASAHFGPEQATPADFLAAAAEARGNGNSESLHIEVVTARPTRSGRAPSLAKAPLAQLSPSPVESRVTPIDQPPLQTVDRAAATPLILPTLYNERGRLIVPAPLLGSREILLHQNEMADQDGLVRVQDEDSLQVLRERGLLLPLPVNAGLRVDERMPANRRYCRPWTTAFLLDLGREHFARFHTPLQVNSAVRTVEFQQRLLRTNGNAAPADGSSASPHLTGQAVDIGKHGLSRTEIAWLRGYLLPLIQVGSIDVEEEFQQSCFHISVYRRYAPSATPRSRYLAASRNGTSALAAAIR